MWFWRGLLEETARDESHEEQIRYKWADIPWDIRCWDLKTTVQKHMQSCRAYACFTKPSKFLSEVHHFYSQCARNFSPGLLLVRREIGHKEDPPEAAFDLTSPSAMQLLAKLEHSCVLQGWIKAVPAVPAWSATTPCRGLIPAMTLGSSTALPFGATVHRRAVGRFWVSVVSEDSSMSALSLSH